MSNGDYGQVFERFASTIETGLMLLDRDLKVVSINRWIEERLEKPAERVIGKPVTEAFQLDEDCRFVMACQQTAELGTPSMLSNRLNPSMLPLYRLRDFENPDAIISQTISVKRITEGGKFYCTVWVDDVSAAVLREQTLKQLAEDKDLSRAKAERANEMKSEFLATMSHEIRTPMNGVLGMLGLLAKSELDSQQEHFVSLAKSSTNSLLHIINDILDFSKIEADKIELEEFEFDLETLFTEIAHGLVIKAKEKDLELILDISGLGRTHVKADPGRIRQILTNLVGNAIKFTDQGEVTITAGLDEVDGQILLRCDVVDTGIGIPADRIESLFEPFAQQDASTTRKYGGTGLGLSIAKKLCGLMNGEISCESTPGVGSKFSFLIEVESTVAKKAAIMPNVELAGVRVLVVDDNRTNRIALKNQLKHWGMHVELATSGEHALSLVENNGSRFAVGILDMQMPEMDGAMLCKRIRATHSQGELPLIMLTSLTTRGDGMFFAELGFSAYLPKPASPSALRDALKIVVDGGDALEQAQPLVTTHHIMTMNKPDVDSRLRLLVAEDNQINQQLIESLLGDDFDLEFANNGEVALSTLKENQFEAPFDAVLMDCRMPVMDGYEATRAIRAGLEGITQTELPIIALTANALPADKRACLEAGMNDYLSKPVDPDVLEERLDFWLSPRREKRLVR